MPVNQSKVNKETIAALKDACQREASAVRMYRALAEREKDKKRSAIFEKLAKVEEDHARRFGEKLTELGETIPTLDFIPSAREKMITKMRSVNATIEIMEKEEAENAAAFKGTAISDPSVNQLFSDIEKEEEEHGAVLLTMMGKGGSSDVPHGTHSRLEAILKGEKWHVNTGSWIGDAIYGVNDGLGAVFGIVLGMAGYASSKSPNSNVVLAAGLAGMIASALSMGAGAFLAAKSEREVYEAELNREKREIIEDPEHEIEELELIYQLKGFSEEESKTFAKLISQNPEQFLKTMAHEELGLSEQSFPNPIISMFSGSISTAIGGIIPVMPFFFMKMGNPAVIISAVVSMIAHFAVGASKTIVTGRSWFKSGMEMTIVGIIEAILAYEVGLLLGQHVG